jgi:outer membrane protein TolC
MAERKLRAAGQAREISYRGRAENADKESGSVRAGVSMRKGLPNLLAAVAVILALAGCAGPRNLPATQRGKSVSPDAILSQLRTPTGADNVVQQAAFVPPPAKPAQLPAPPEQPLTEPALIEAVLRQNPNLDEMRAAVAAAQAKVPQAISLDDPMVGVWTAPGSYPSDHVNPAVRFEITQKIPWPGKRDFRGASAAAEADAATRDLDDARLQLMEATRAALADLFVAERAMTVNREAQELLKGFRENAQSRYKTGLASQQDILQADVELARQEERAVALNRAKRVAAARLNTLLHRAPQSPFGPVPETLPAPIDPQDPAALRTEAVNARPDVKALADRIRAEEAELGLALSEYKPDVELMAAYDGFWQGTDRPLQFQVGARVNVPVRLGRRDAAVAEAQARVARRRAELARLVDQVGLQVQEAYEQVRESRQVIALYDDRLLPAARSNVKEAQIAYTTGKVPFVALSEAQRTLADRRERYLEAQGELYRRLATLERVTGKPAVTSADTPSPPSAKSR